MPVQVRARIHIQSLHATCLLVPASFLCAAGILWGPDVTEAFLRDNGLRCILRGHEGARRGSTCSAAARVAAVPWS